MANEDRLQKWLQKGNDDLRAAEYLCTMRHPTPDEIICNHCQQSAEKYLKGFLVLHDIEPPKIHDLEDLLAMCEKYDERFSALLSKASILTNYAVMPRYPNDMEITAGDMKTAIQYAKDIQDFVLSVINTR